jgi:hypothetical protein
MDADLAETVALEALAFLAEDVDRLQRFLASTGAGPADLRQGARTPRTLAAVLEHLMQDENLLLVFATSRAIAPELIAPAHSLLERQAQSGAA